MYFSQLDEFSVLSVWIGYYNTKGKPTAYTRIKGTAGPLKDLLYFLCAFVSTFLSSNQVNQSNPDKPNNKSLSLKIGIRENSLQTFLPKSVSFNPDEDEFCSIFRPANQPPGQGKKI